MGVISISMSGSFPQDNTTISAEEGGHANAIQRGIEFLNDRLLDAIELDHKLQERKQLPPKAPFGRGGR